MQDLKLLVSYPWKTQNVGYFVTGILLSCMFCNASVVGCAKQERNFCVTRFLKRAAEYDSLLSVAVHH